ncbi:hypothetical protein EJ02DRAFT_340781 [Clathrospora elynae]|uniref:Uncharacterized protein n=1 Tax=Clathrospora elynae TaxID=706981 RepID=A0A6A5SWD2_9PLEO|nr:hypothetical protein EJ02DRAFT_340781 [Clathrospora elynae]
MHLSTLLSVLLASLPSTLSFPASNLPADDPYQCGYVLTEHNSSAYAGLSAFSYCSPFYYNQSISGFQDAFAYRLWGGCQCEFYSDAEECWGVGGAPVCEGPTTEKDDVKFEKPMPMWYYCKRTE